LLFTESPSASSIAKYERLNMILDQPEFGHLQKNLAIVWIRSSSSLVKFPPQARLHGPQIRLSPMDNSPVVQLRTHKIIIDMDLANLKHIVWVDHFLHELCSAGNYAILNAIWSIGIEEFAELNSRSGLQAEYLGQIALSRAASDLFKSGIGMVTTYRRLDKEENLPILTNSLQAPHALPSSQQFELDLYMQNLRLKGMNMMLSKEEEAHPKALSMSRHNTPSPVLSESKRTIKRSSPSTPGSQKSITPPSSQTRRVNLYTGSSTSSLIERKTGTGPEGQTTKPALALHVTSGTRRLSDSSQSKKQNSFSNLLDQVLKT